ncbi:MAG: amine oxidase, partial [Alcaligenaceae bacterium]
WVMEMSMPLTGFTKDMVPPEVTRAYKRAHWGPSVKVYAPLKPSFFTDPSNKIPQILVTDTFLHDVYAYKYGVGDYEFPCILMSYTWEDDSEKFASLRDDAAIIDKIVDELDRILMRSTNIKQSISPYILKEHGVVQRWSEDGYAKGCAKFYRAGGYADAARLAAYTGKYSDKSGLYLAGEGYSLDGGWTEPCFRGAADTVIHLLKNTASKFNGGFTLADYPSIYVPD